MIPSRYKIVTLASALAIVILDQLSKWAARNSFLPGESKAILAGFFNLILVRNTGAVWGCFQNQSAALALVSLAALALIGFFYRYLVNDRKIYAWALGCIAGGIIGNLIDRIKLGAVTDFLDFYWRNYHWPAFNIADAAICLGVALYLLVSLYQLDADRRKGARAADH